MNNAIICHPIKVVLITRSRCIFSNLIINNIIKNSELKIIKDGKHLCGIECADDVNLAIKNFIDENE